MCDYLVTDKEIDLAESEIFDGKKSYNDEQRSFIKCLDSCHLQAYAGTGKTSTIVGKLHVLAQKKSWSNGRGICVISHTNVAIDEVRKHVAKTYPSIMEYPNFVGTIQEFINKFIFTPFLASKGLKINFQNDNFQYNSDWALASQLKSNTKSVITQATRIYPEWFKKCYISDKKPLFDGHPFPLDAINNKRTRAPKVPESELDNINDYFIKLIEKRMLNGRFLYAESFIDGYKFIKENPVIKEIISQRFQFVFLDEAQDCSEMQLKIIRDLFADRSSVLQEIGDVNQSVTENSWNPVDPLCLGESMRFGKSLSDFINKLRIDSGCGIKGCEKETAKFLIIYELGKESEVIEEFSNILSSSQLPESSTNYYGISSRHNLLNKYYGDYSEGFAKNKNKKRSIFFESDADYLDTITAESLLINGSNYISNILTSILYKHFKKSGKSKNELRDMLRYGEKSDEYKLLLMELCNDLLINNKISSIERLENNLNSILVDHESKITFSLDDSGNEIFPQQIAEANIYKAKNGIKINIGTIHSVKGQTHDATLVFSDSVDGKQDIKHVIDNTAKFGPKYKKLLYVAFSRPVNLVAIAIRKNEYDNLTVGDKKLFEGFEVRKLESK